MLAKAMQELLMLLPVDVVVATAAAECCWTNQQMLGSAMQEDCGCEGCDGPVCPMLL